MTGSRIMTDRSVPRRARAAGDASRDGRGRVLSVPPILQYGFRPFFFLASLHAGLAIPAWLWLFYSGTEPYGPFASLEWHVHEMLFGYLAAVIAGFILTAVPNWTGCLPLSGGRLAVLAGLWLAGRLACLLQPDPVMAMVIGLMFPVALAAAIWREVLAGRNWRNAPVAVMLTLFAIANALHHGENLAIAPDDLGIRMALGAVAMLIVLIGGRIVPSFTRNWLARNGQTRLPASLGGLDKLALIVTGTALVFWIARPHAAATGIVLVSSGGLLMLRLARWRGLAAIASPIVFVLHAGYGWLAASMLLLGAAILWDGIPQSAAVHALTAGAIGTMTLAVMTRASLGHTGRVIRSDGWTVAIYVLVTLGALTRVAAPLAGTHYLPTLAIGGALWSLAFLTFAATYGPMLWRPRLVG